MKLRKNHLTKDAMLFVLGLLDAGMNPENIKELRRLVELTHESEQIPLSILRVDLVRQPTQKEQELAREIARAERFISSKKDSQ